MRMFHLLFDCLSQWTSQLFSQLGSILNWVSERLVLACHEFSHSFSAAKEFRALGNSSAPIESTRIHGYLIGKNRVLTLREGMQTWLIGSDGRPYEKSRLSTEENSSLESYRTCIQQGKVLVEKSGSNSSRQTLESNESLSIGREHFVVKLLPQPIDSFVQPLIKVAERKLIVALLVFIFFGSAWAEEITSSLAISGDVISGNPVTANVILSPASAEKIEWVGNEISRGTSLKVQGHALPLDLWILIDTSSVCALQKLDVQVPVLLKALKRGFPADTLISLLDFNNEQREILLNQVSLDKVEDVPVRCAKNSLSSSPERALESLFDVTRLSGLPRVIWVFSGGNISLSESMQRKLNEAKTDVRFILYNPIVENEVKPIVESMNRSQKREFIRLTRINSKTILLPERWFRVEISPPRFGFMKGNQSIRLAAVEQGQPKAEMEVLLDFEGRRAWTLFDGLILLSVVILLTVLVYFTYTYYYPRNCKNCKRALRPLQAHCLFCFHQNTGFIAGAVNYRSSEKWQRIDLLPVGLDGIFYGTSRRHGVWVPRLLGERKGTYLRVYRQEGKSPKFMAVPKLKSPLIQLNGRPLEGPTYLADGDHIQCGEITTQFIYEGRTT